MNYSTEELEELLEAYDRSVNGYSDSIIFNSTTGKAWLLERLREYILDTMKRRIQFEVENYDKILYIKRASTKYLYGSTY